MNSSDEQSAVSVFNEYENIIKLISKHTDEVYSARQILIDNDKRAKQLEKIFTVVEYYQNKCEASDHRHHNGSSALKSSWHNASDSAYICEICGKEVVK